MVRCKLNVKMGLMVLALAAAILTKATMVGAQEGAAKSPPEWGGQYSSQKRPMFSVIKSQEQWQELFAAAFNRTTAPEVDFQRYVVAAVFMGLKMTGGYRVEFKEPYVKDNKLIIPFQEQAPAPGSIVTQALTTPFRLKVIARKGEEVVLKNLLEISEIEYRPFIMYSHLNYQIKYFKCKIPQYWYVEKGWSPLKEGAEATGILLMAPAEIAGDTVKIAISYYSLEKDVPLSIELYVEENPLFLVIMKGYGEGKFRPWRQTTLNGRRATWFDRENVNWHGDKIRENLVAISAPKGFFALHYWAPAVSYDKYLPVFERLVKSFQPVP